MPFEDKTTRQSTIQFFPDGFTVEHYRRSLFRHHFFCNESRSPEEFSEILSQGDNLGAIMRLSDHFPQELSIMILKSHPFQIRPIAC